MLGLVPLINYRKPVAMPRRSAIQFRNAVTLQIIWRKTLHAIWRTWRTPQVMNDRALRSRLGCRSPITDVRLTPRCLAIERLLTPSFRSRFISGMSFAAVFGRPWGLPSFRARSIPAMTRSLRMSRSNSAKTASMPASALPLRRRQSSASLRETNPTSKALNSCSALPPIPHPALRPLQSQARSLDSVSNRELMKKLVPDGPPSCLRKCKEGAALFLCVAGLLLEMFL